MLCPFPRPTRHVPPHNAAVILLILPTCQGPEQLRSLQVFLRNVFTRQFPSRYVGHLSSLKIYWRTSPGPLFGFFLIGKRNVPNLSHLAQEEIVRTIVVEPEQYQCNLGNLAGLKVGHLGNHHKSPEAVVSNLWPMLKTWRHELTIDPVTMPSAWNCQDHFFRLSREKSSDNE